MNCCPNCFKDPYAASEIKRLAAGTKVPVGKCDFCGAENVQYLVELKPESELADMFAKLIEVLVVCDGPAPDGVAPRAMPFEDMLQNTWGLFNFASTESMASKIKAFLSCLFPEDQSVSRLYGRPVRVADSYNDVTRREACALGDKDWDRFARELRLHRRLTSKPSEEYEDALTKLSAALWKEIPPGSDFYRARIWNAERQPMEEDMSEPPVSSAGRMNAQGIKCLYLSADEVTAVSEVRAGSHDCVALVRWRTTRTLKVIDLTELERVSPFMDIDVYTLMANLNFLRRFAKEMARPQCQGDDTLNYLSTQYWCEALRFSSDSDEPYDGFIYKSVMRSGGENMIVYGGVEGNFEAASRPYIRRVGSIEYSLDAVD